MILQQENYSGKRKASRQERKATRQQIRQERKATRQKARQLKKSGQKAEAKALRKDFRRKARTLRREKDIGLLGIVKSQGRAAIGFFAKKQGGQDDKLIKTTGEGAELQKAQENTTTPTPIIRGGENIVSEPRFTPISGSGGFSAGAELQEQGASEEEEKQNEDEGGNTKNKKRLWIAIALALLIAIIVFLVLRKE